MNDRDRLEQLRGMLDRLERMPASPDRDWLFGEVRARRVDVETGAPPAPMRSHDPDEVDLELAAGGPSTIKATQRKASRRVGERHAEAPAPARVVQSARPPVPAAPTRRESWVDLLEQGGLLSLAEPSTGAPGGNRPWTRGLRG
jgi:hypothetical protein